MRELICTVVGVLLTVGPVAAAAAKGAKETGHTLQSTQFGVSGGNANDSSGGWCCGGTLGAMLVDNPLNPSTRYVLSNRHVLAVPLRNPVGANISQPGLIDWGCKTPPTVATFTAAAQLGPYVDAAVGTLQTGVPNAMNLNGSIMDIGVPNSLVKPPQLGLLVAKSGRTTGLTTGKVSSINTSVRVGYSDACGAGTSITVSYTNQVAVTGPKFSAAGDSGSLIVTSASHQPVALLFAGGGSTTIGNPIQAVLDALSTAVGGGKTLSFLATAPPASAGQPTGAPSDALVEHAKNVKNAHEKQIMDMDGVIGVGVGDDDLSPGEAFINVYIDQSKGKDPAVPNQIDGVRVKKIKTDPFIAYGCCDKCR